MNVFISGVQGFLGRHLTQHLTARGHQVRGTTSRATASSPSPGQTYLWRLGEPVDTAWFRDIDVVVHCAHDFDNAGVNRDGTRDLASAARTAGVQKQVFISSLSARADTDSEYGRTKFAIETDLTGPDLIIVRPGTIVGRGGLFGRMSDAVRRGPVVPVIGGGEGPMYLISASDLCRAIERVIDIPPPAVFNLYYVETPTMSAVLRKIKRLTGSRALLVPAPLALVAFALTVADVIGLRLPVNRDNLRGFSKSRTQIYATDLLTLLDAPQSVDAALEGTLAAAPAGQTPA